MNFADRMMTIRRAPGLGSAPATAAPGAATLVAGHPMVVEAVPATILRSRNIATLNPAWRQFVHPDFNLPPAADTGQPRGAFALPTMIAPGAPPSDVMAFEDPADAGHKFYLPRYVLATSAGALGPQKWVALAASGQGFALIVHLSEIPAPADATRITVDERIFLTAALGGRQIEWDLTPAPGSDGASLRLDLALAAFADRDLVYQAMTDPAATARLIIRRSLPLAVPADGNPSLYHGGPTTIDSAIAFVFSKELDAAVFAGAGSASAADTTMWHPVTLNWNGRQHQYFQSRAQPDQIYFLPDAFKVARGDAPPHAPALSVSSSGADAASTQMTMAYLAQPVWDPARIIDAGQELAPLLGLATPPSFALFDAVDAKLWLTLPVAGGNGATALTLQSDAIVDTGAGVRGAVTLGLGEFRQLYDALFNTVSPILAGEVRLAVEATQVALPFVARAGDFAGDTLSVTSVADVHAGHVVATLINAIESPVEIAALSGTILNRGKPIQTQVVAVNPAPPLVLAAATPGRDPMTVTVTLAPATGAAVADLLGGLLGGLLNHTHPNAGGAAADLAGSVLAGALDASATALVDFSKTTVNADPQAMWKAIMGQRSLGPVSRQVTLRSVAAMLAPVTPVRPDALMAIQVVFDSGQTATFDASQTPDAAGFLNQTIHLSMPIEAFVLGSADTGGYRYRIDRVTASGIVTGAWLNDNRDLLFVIGG